MSSPRERLLGALAGPAGGAPVVSPLTDRNLAAGVMGKRVPQVTVEDELATAERCGYDPIVIIDSDWGRYDPALHWREETLSEDERGLLKRKTLATPWGPWRIVYHELYASSPEQTEFPLQGPGDFEVLLWYAERIRGCGRGLAEYVAGVRQAVAERGLICLRLGYPHELLSYSIPYLLSPISLTDRIYYYYDYPDLYRQAMEAVHRTGQWLVETAAAAGCDGFFLGSFGTEVFSPQLFSEAILPYGRDMCRWIREQGAFSLYHACGHNRVWLEKGYLNQVRPDILEGFAPPPAGTVDDLAGARRVTDPAICTRGNLDIELLRNGTPGAVEEATRRVLEATRGYRHIVGGACTALYGTPVENLQAMARAARAWQPTQRRPPAVDHARS